MKFNKSLFVLLVVSAIGAINIGMFFPVLLHHLFPHQGNDLINQTVNNVALASSFIVVLSPAYILASPLLCVYSDCWRRKPVILGVIFIGFIGDILCYFGAMWQITSVILFAAIFVSISVAVMPLILTCIGDITKGPQRSYAYALFVIMIILMTPAAQFSNYLLHISENSPSYIHTPLAITSSLQLINLIIVKFFLKETKNRVTNKKESNEIYWLKLVRVLRQPNMIFCLLVLFIFQIARALYYQDIFYFLSNTFAQTEKQASFFLLIFSLITFFSLILLYPLLNKKLSIKKMLNVSLIIGLIGITFGYYAKNFTLLWLSTVFIAVSFALFLPSMLYTISKVSGEQHRGFFMGIVILILAVGWMCSGIISSSLNNNTLVYPIQIVCLITVLALGVYSFNKSLSYD